MEPKKQVCISNRKKSKRHLSRCVTNNYIDMRIQQPDSSVIRYQTTPPDDMVARLQRKIDRGEAKLTFEERHGYLVSVLQQLNIPVSSQMLVFSKISTQQFLLS